jgi:O-antigen/teichoic acid export membrane protein
MRLLRNALSNFSGGFLPAVVTVVTIPLIVTRLGVVDYGVLTIISAVIGYFALLDVNVTAGAVKYVSEYDALGDAHRVSQVVSFGTVIYAAIGLIGAVIIFFTPDLLADHVFEIPSASRERVVAALQISAPAFFFGQIQAYLASVPQALQRYDLSARIEVFFGTFLPLATVAVLLAGGGLVEVVWLRTGASVLNCIVLGLSVRRLLPAVRFAWPDRVLRGKLVSFSSYAYLSRMASVLYNHADKLIIGSFLGMGAVTYYSVPATLANRLLGLTFRLSAVVYPAASALLATQSIDSLKSIYLKASRYLYFINAAIVTLLCVFAPEVLSHWIGADFVAEGVWVMRLVALSMLIDSMTNLPSMLNDSGGHPRVTGLFAVSRAVLGLAVTIVAAKWGGIISVAAAHLLASGVMATAFLCFVHGRTVPVELSLVLKRSYVGATLFFLVLGGAAEFFRPGTTLGLLPTALAGALMVALTAAFGLLGIAGKDDLHNLRSRLFRRPC